MMAGTLNLAFVYPAVTGLNASHFLDLDEGPVDPAGPETGWREHGGLVCADGAPKPAYFGMKARGKSLAARALLL